MSMLLYILLMSGFFLVHNFEIVPYDLGFDFFIHFILVWLYSSSLGKNYDLTHAGNNANMTKDFE